MILHYILFLIPFTMDIHKILQISHDELGEDEKDDLYNNITEIDIEKHSLNKNELRSLFFVTQEMLKYKGGQVESLISEFDEIAIRQGKEEAKMIQDLKNEIRMLKSSGPSTKPVALDTAKENEELRLKIKNQKLNIKIQRQEMEKLSNDIILLQEENRQLQTELQLGHRDSDSQSETAEINVQQNQELVDNIQQKNKQISQLLTDFESIEKENVVLKEKIVMLRDELKQATKNILQLTDELTGYKNIMNENKDKENILAEENEALRNQIKELVEQQQQREIQIDSFSDALNTRVETLKKLLKDKQSEMEELKAQNQNLQKELSLTQGDSGYTLISKLAEKEDEIAELQTKLLEAIKEIEDNASLIENIQTKPTKTDDIKGDENLINDLKKQLESSHKRCQKLQEGITKAEEDSQIHEKQLNELLNRMRAYEEGNYGLTDALNEIKDFGKQIQSRDKQISGLIKNTNSLQMAYDEMEMQNLIFRQRLGISEESPVNTKGIISKHRKQKKLLNTLNKQIQILEDDKLELKIENQTLKRKLSQLNNQMDGKGIKSDIIDGQIAFGDVDYEKRFMEAVEENEALRKGLHEILESINIKDGSSKREIKSDTLEKLLQTLDVRHISGWYHPAMRVQAELHSLQGVNAELRNQNRLLRADNNEELKSCKLKIHELQTQLTEMISKSGPGLDSGRFVPSDISELKITPDGKYPAHLDQILKVIHKNNDTYIKLQTESELLKTDLKKFKGRLRYLSKNYLKEKELWSAKYNVMDVEKETLTKSLDTLKSSLHSALNMNEGSPRKDFVLKLTDDLVSLNRKCLYLDNIEKKLNAEISKLKTELSTSQSAALERIIGLEETKDNLSHKVAKLEENLRDTVSKNDFKATKKQIYDLTIKQQESIHSEEKYLKNTNHVSLLEKEIELLNAEKSDLMNIINDLKSKKNEHVDEGLSKKLATSEINELSERQRADHTNSLYALVKDQLKKSEERYHEIDTQNKILLNSNLKMQLTLQEAQDKFINCIPIDDFNDISNKLNEANNDILYLKSENSKLINRYNTLESEVVQSRSIKFNQEMELNNLKHLVLDLQSASDDKALIARLSTEVVLARLCESDAKNKLNEVKKELMYYQSKHKDIEDKFQNTLHELNQLDNKYQEKNRKLEYALHSLRLQYLGCIPLSTRERFIENLKEMFANKQISFQTLISSEKEKNKVVIIREQLETELKNATEMKLMFSKNGNGGICEKILEWHRDKNTVQLNELKQRRNTEFKEMQLQQAMKQMKNQENQLLKIEEELLILSDNQLREYLSDDNLPLSEKLQADKETMVDDILNKTTVEVGIETHFIEKLITKEVKGTQTSPDDDNKDDLINSLRSDLQHANQLISVKDTNLQRQQTIITDLEKNMETLKIQLTDKQSLNQSTGSESRQQINVIDEIDLEEYNNLKNLVVALQLTISEKENEVMRYQTMLKEHKDEYSLAASRLQDEIKQLQVAFVQQTKHELQVMKSAAVDPQMQFNKLAIENYVGQVHVLESHMAEMQTSVTSLNSQLQASRQESVRWRTLANDRLKTIEQLNNQFDNQHLEEITIYKDECEKWKTENIAIKQELSKLRVELSNKNTNSSQLLQEKDMKINELKMKTVHFQNELDIQSKDIQSHLSSQIKELELNNQMMKTEHDSLRKRFDQVVNREKLCREQIRELKGQLIKRPLLSARSDRSDKAIKEQLQKKVSTLEKDLSEAKQQLEKEAAINETRRIKIADDFALWDKQKRWQQTAEKLKEKLTAKTEEYEKLEQSYKSAKSIIHKLEREKHILEGKLKASKCSSVAMATNQLETLELDNARLLRENVELASKLEMQQHHAGSLGAALLQEKLEAQERKIAVLELSSKGSVGVTAELERLNSTLSSLQKSNLRLEAENLELRLDLERAGADGPYLREQIQHLQRYIDALKAEHSSQNVISASGDQIHPPKRTADLEKTVLSLRRLVEKLQSENKRLQTRPCTLPERQVSSSDKLQADFKKLKEQFGETLQKNAKLEEELASARKKVKFLESVLDRKRNENDTSLASELLEVKTQLANKSQLLDKVKILLQKAAEKERALQEQVNELMRNAPAIIDETTDLNDFLNNQQ